jgi:hypothetical protein
MSVLAQQEVDGVPHRSLIVNQQDIDGLHILEVKKA